MANKKSKSENNQESKPDNSVKVTIITTIGIIVTTLITALVAPAILRTLEKTPTQSPLPESTITSDVFIEDFSQGSKYWQTGLKDDDQRTATRSVVDGALRWQVIAKEETLTGIGSTSLLPLLSDFDLETTLKLVQAPESFEYGVRFRSSDAGFYYFLINRKGQFLLAKLLTSPDDHWVNLVWWTDSSVINLSGENMFRIRAVDNKIRLYINQALLADLADDSLSSGKTDIVAWVHKDTTSIVDMTSFKVTLLSP